MDSKKVLKFAKKGRFTRAEMKAAEEALHKEMHDRAQVDGPPDEVVAVLEPRPDLPAGFRLLSKEEADRVLSEQEAQRGGAR